MDAPKFKDFKESIVAFVDILGFDNRARNIKTEEDFTDISTLLFALQKFAKDFSQENDIFNEYELTAISDSLIVSVPYQNPISTYGLLTILHHFQYSILATSFKTLVRGFITKGKVYHKDGILFGKGYSDAYKLESKTGGLPRIVISPNIVTDALDKIEKLSEKKEISKYKTILDFIIQDPSDGLYFIDYLKPVGTQIQQTKEELFMERSSIHAFIDEQLGSSNENISLLQKYSWLRWYFDNSLKHIDS